MVARRLGARLGRRSTGRPPRPPHTRGSVTRPARPDDLYRLAVPSTRASPRRPPRRFHGPGVPRAGEDGYRHAIWLVPADGSAPARAGDARAPGTTRSPVLARRPDARVPVGPPAGRRGGAGPAQGPGRTARTASRSTSCRSDGGEARRLTDLPARRHGLRLVAGWPAARRGDARRSGRRARRTGAAAGGQTTPKPGEPPLSDYRYIDRLRYQYNGAGSSRTRWRTSGSWTWPRARPARSSTGPTRRRRPPPGRPTARGSRSRPNRRRDRDIDWRCDGLRRSSGDGRGHHDRGRERRAFRHPGVAPATAGHRWRWATASRAAPVPDRHLAVRRGRLGRGARAAGRTSSASSDLKPGAAMNSDVTIGEGPASSPRRTGPGSCSRAPIDGLLRAVADRRRGRDALERLTERPALPLRLGHGRRGGGGTRHAVAVDPLRPRRPSRRSWPSSRRPAKGPTRGRVPGLTALNGELARRARPGRTRGAPLDERRLRDPGLALPAGRPPGRAAAGRWRSTAARTPSTAGRRSSSGRSWRAPGSALLASNPRGSEGYSEAFNRANLGDWGEGPMARCPRGRGRAIADGLADPDAARRDRRLVRRLPDELDRRAGRTGSGRRSPAVRSWTCGCSS